MTVMIKTMQVADLPAGWQAELGLAADGIVRIEIRVIPSAEEAARQERLLRQLHDIKPVAVEIDSTNLIRSDREIRDGRNRRSSSSIHRSSQRQS